MARANMEETFFLERLQEIDGQIPLLKHRPTQQPMAVLLIYIAILIFLISMFAIALSITLNFGSTVTVALTCFLLGTCLLLVSSVFSSQEIWMSHQAICYEVDRIISLNRFF